MCVRVRVCVCVSAHACVSLCDVEISCGCSSFVVRYNWFHHCLYAQHSTYLGNNALQELSSYVYVCVAGSSACLCVCLFS